MKRLVLLAAAAVLGLACGSTAGGARPASTAAPDVEERGVARLVVTERDHGKTLTLRLGRTGKRVLAAGARGRVVTTGRAVLVVRIESYAPTSRQQFELRAVRTGTTTISAPRANGTRFRVAIRVP